MNLSYIILMSQMEKRDYYGKLVISTTEINLETLEIKISLPPLPEQKAIAGVLSSLDDKIDLLQRQNQTLEALAETLFRQWFVEEARMIGRETLGDIAKYSR